MKNRLTGKIIDWYESNGWPFAKIVQNGVISHNVDAEQTMMAMVDIYEEVMERQSREQDVDLQQVVWRVWAKAKTYASEKYGLAGREVVELKAIIEKKTKWLVISNLVWAAVCYAIALCYWGIL